MSTVRRVILHNLETGISDGEILEVQNIEGSMTLDIKTDATVLEISFESQNSDGLGVFGDWTPFICYSFNDATASSETKNSISEKWQVEIGAIDRFRAKITSQTSTLGTTLVCKTMR